MKTRLFVVTHWRETGACPSIAGPAQEATQETTLTGRKMPLPNEMDVLVNGHVARVRFDYDQGEREWFDARAGVGSPGYPPSVEVWEVRFVDCGWETPDHYPGIDWQAVEDEIMKRLGEFEAVEQEARAEREREYDANDEPI